MITAVGSIPTDELTADNLGGDNAPLGRVIHRRVLAYRNDANRLHQFTWADFIKNYANKWGGAHLDEEIPAILATADAHSTGRTALASHLLRTMAVAARNAAQEIFCKIMRSDLTEPERDGWYSLAAIAPDGRPPLYYDNGALITLTISAESAYIGVRYLRSTSRYTDRPMSTRRRLPQYLLPPRRAHGTEYSTTTPIARIDHCTNAHPWTRHRDPPARHPGARTRAPRRPPPRVRAGCVG